MTKKPEAKKTMTKTRNASKATKPAPMPAAKRPVRAKTAKATREPKDEAAPPQAATPTPVAGETKGSTSMTSRMTCLDAAHAVLTRLNKPMRIREIMEQMVDRELWLSPGGSTPDATLTSAIIRDIAKRGDASRFKRVNRGYYAAKVQ